MQFENLTAALIWTPLTLAQQHMNVSLGGHASVSTRCKSALGIRVSHGSVRGFQENTSVDTTGGAV